MQSKGLPHKILLLLLVFLMLKLLVYVCCGALIYSGQLENMNQDKRGKICMEKFYYLCPSIEQMAIN